MFGKCPKKNPAFSMDNVPSKLLQLFYFNSISSYPAI
jgi:hypothetical protein